MVTCRGTQNLTRTGCCVVTALTLIVAIACSGPGADRDDQVLVDRVGVPTTVRQVEDSALVEGRLTVGVGDIETMVSELSTRVAMGAILSPELGPSYVIFADVMLPASRCTCRWDGQEFLTLAVDGPRVSFATSTIPLSSFDDDTLLLGWETPGDELTPRFLLAISSRDHREPLHVLPSQGPSFSLSRVDPMDQELPVSVYLAELAPRQRGPYTLTAGVDSETDLAVRVLPRSQ